MASVTDPRLWRMWCQVCGAEAPEGGYNDAPPDCPKCGGYHWASYPKGGPVPDIAVEHATDRFALVVKQYGGPTDPSMTHDAATEPFGTMTTSGQQSVVEMDHVPIAVEDCGFRMLEPHEIKAAMAFPESYVVLGTKRDRVRQLGNAVTPPVLQLLVERCMEALA